MHSEALNAGRHRGGLQQVHLGRSASLWRQCHRQSPVLSCAPVAMAEMCCLLGDLVPEERELMQPLQSCRPCVSCYMQICAGHA